MLENEEKIVEKAQNGDNDALATLVNEYHDRIYHLGLSMLKQEQDAEDMLQETFLTLVEKIQQFKGNSSIYTWLYRIATNIALKKLKSKPRKYPHIPIDEPDFKKIHEEETKEEMELDFEKVNNYKFRKILNDLLDELPPKYKTVFILRDLHDLSTRETAKILDLTESNTKVRLFRARNYLKEKLEQLKSEELMA
jgi:RNA polymerase sigma-70 factor (ECF subfamily)